jgi:hypothetical protein
MTTVMPEVEVVLARLAVIEKQVIDPSTLRAVNVYENIPFSINVGDMPLFINFVGPLTSDEVTGSDDKGRTMTETRSYKPVLYHSPFPSGTSQENYGYLTPYFEQVYQLFGSYPHLKQLAGVIDATLIGDSGMGVVEFQGQKYYGITFTLQVHTKLRRLFADYE